MYDDLLFGELGVNVQPDNTVLPEAELQERRSCTLAWSVDQDPIVKQFLGLADSDGLPDQLGKAIFERICRAVAGGKDRQPRRKKAA